MWEITWFPQQRPGDLHGVDNLPFHASSPKSRENIVNGQLTVKTIRNRLLNYIQCYEKGFPGTIRPIVEPGS
jgi:hypothetical protein